MTRSGTIAERLLLAAYWVMPAGHRPWVKAMAAELRYVPPGTAAVFFAFGCLRAASLRRCTTAYLGSPFELAVGALTGTTFIGHAFLPDSQGWPWIWPALGGAVISIGRERGDHLGWDVVASGLKAGLVCGIVFIVLGMAALAIAVLSAGYGVLWRDLGLIAYGAFGATILAPVSAAATIAVADRLRS